jgi:hypothetical protein
VTLVISPQGDVRCLYSENINLVAIGSLSIIRASHVEPDAQGFWIADLSPVHGPSLGPFALRSEALAAEVAWLEGHRLSAIPPSPRDSEVCAKDR